jgi:signal transduction histidine kinase
LFLYLLLFAILPAGVLLVGGATIVNRALPLLGGSEAWERVATSGRGVVDAFEGDSLSVAQRQALEAHERELNASLEQARRIRYLATRAPAAVAILALLGLAALGIGASRVAAHLSRQLSRPLDELVGWAGLIAEGKPLPAVPPRKRGAPEFSVLRRRMRRMAEELEQARDRELEAERLSAFREAARRVAHELKNPLTPIRFAVERLRREASPQLGEVVEVLDTETQRLDRLARTFAQFGRLPEGPPSEIDLGELARYSARATVPADLPVELDIESDVPLVWGQHDSIARALSNVLLNAVDACQANHHAAKGVNESASGSITVRVARTELRGGPAVEVSVRDSGCGIAADRLATIWEPYATYKPGGTGLGLAIARQAIDAHGGEAMASSAPGRGTEIRFVLPVGSPAAPTQPAQFESPLLEPAR